MNNAITICTLLAAAAAASVTAYDFKDSEFNQILALDLGEFYDYNTPYSHPRARRDEEAAGKDNCRQRRRGRLCCGENLLEGLHEKERDLKRACFQELFGKDRPEKPRFDPFRCEDHEKRRKEMTCLVQCVGQKQELLDTDGNLKEEEFREFLKESFASESWLASLQDEIISTCVAEAKEAAAKRDTADSGSCNPAGIKTVHCLFREIQLNCPAEQIKDEQSCTRLKERLKSSDSFGPGPDDGPDN